MEEIKKEGFFTRLGKGLKYRVRKTLIAIYHNPYTVVLLLSAVSMMYFTFNFQKVAYEVSEGLLSGIANGFFMFMWTICAYLSVVSYLFYSGKTNQSKRRDSNCFETLSGKNCIVLLS